MIMAMIRTTPINRRTNRRTRTKRK